VGGVTEELFVSGEMDPSPSHPSDPSQTVAKVAEEDESTESDRRWDSSLDMEREGRVIRGFVSPSVSSDDEWGPTIDDSNDEGFLIHEDREEGDKEAPIKIWKNFFP